MQKTMRGDFGFLPDARRARHLDRRMHRELGASLQHVCEASDGIIPFDRDRMEALGALLAAGGPVSPSVFGTYYELVIAIAEERLDAAAALFEELAEAGPAEQGLQVATLGGDELGPGNGRYMRMMNSDAGTDVGFQPPTPEVASAFRSRLDEGLGLLNRALPELAGEIRGLVRQIVIAGSDPSKKMQFDGGSHYQLWGALFLNGEFHPDAVAVAEVLAHESAHSLLFGFCTEEPLVENSDDELFSSPLRLDPRPMDGIYHATFVSARMHWAMSQLARSSALSSEQQQRAREAAAVDLGNFDEGYRIVARHALLTGVGTALMDAAKRYRDGIRD